MDNYLMHYGILGMKWGVRRFENEDGSYTKAGLERYRKAKAKYNETGSAHDKEVMKRAKKDLKYDVKADKGRVRYSKGERITADGDMERSRLVSQIGATMASGSAIMYRLGMVNKKEFALVAVSSAAVSGAAYVDRMIRTYGKDAQLRAFYGRRNMYNVNKNKKKR